VRCAEVAQLPKLDHGALLHVTCVISVKKKKSDDCLQCGMSEGGTAGLC
jgi:hypothetical protein